MLSKEKMAVYNKEYYAAHKPPTKKEQKLNDLRQLFAYLSMKNGGRTVDASAYYWNEDDFLDEIAVAVVRQYMENGWSNIFIINNSTIADTLEVNRMTVGKYIAELVAENSLIKICDYYFEGSSYPCAGYITNLKEYTNTIVNKYWSVVNEDDDDEETSKKHKTSSFASKVAKVEMCNIFKSDITDEHVLYLDQVNGNYKHSRYYNVVSQTPNPEKHPDSNRYAVLKELYGMDSPEEIDINACILRTNYNIVSALTGRAFLPVDADPYYELYKACEFCANDDYDSFRNKAYNGITMRELFKSLVMPCFMKPQSLKYNANKLQHEYKTLRKEYIENKKYNYYVQFVNDVMNDQYNNFVMRFKKAVYSFLTIDVNKAFLPKRNWMMFEAGVYTYMSKRFNELGIVNANVYDGFYFEKGTCTKEQFYEVYHAAINDMIAVAKSTNFDFEQYFVEYSEADFTIGMQTACKIHSTNRTANAIYVNSFDGARLLEPINYDFSKQCYVDSIGKTYMPTKQKIAEIDYEQMIERAKAYSKKCKEDALNKANSELAEEEEKRSIINFLISIDALNDDELSIAKTMKKSIAYLREWKADEEQYIKETTKC